MGLNVGCDVVGIGVDGDMVDGKMNEGIDVGDIVVDGDIHEGVAVEAASL